jgi:hypothetical protein
VKLTIAFDTDNASFEADPSFETWNVLRRLAGKFLDAHVASGSGPVQDTNGNTIGTWTWQ